MSSNAPATAKDRTLDALERLFTGDRPTVHEVSEAIQARSRPQPIDPATLPGAPMPAAEDDGTEDRHEKRRQAHAVVYEESGPARADHPWLAGLGLPPVGNLRQCGNALVAPLLDVAGTLQSYANITARGEVRMQRGGHVQGCFFPMPALPDQAARLAVACSLEDGLRHHHATGETTLAALHVGNLAPVREAVKARYPGASIGFVDRWTSPALREATEKTETADDTTPEPEAAEESQPEPAPAKPPKRSQADALLELAAGFEYFHDPEGRGYAWIERDGYRECHPIRSKSFRDVLRHGHYAASGRGVSAQALQDTIDALDARALFDGPEAPVFLRIARQDDQTLVIDLGDAQWRAVVITPHGWKVVERSPVAFRRTATMQALPQPVRGGRIDELRHHLNVAPHDFPLVVGWLLGALRGRGPYALLLLQGEQGSGKSILSKMLRALLDPSAVPLKALPKTENDLAIIARNSAVVCLDNLSGLDASMSDALCRLTTGGGISARQLYTDFDEAAFSACAPGILNGIDDIATRPDLIERGIMSELPVIVTRRTEQDIWANFEVARPRLLGALYSALSAALANETKSCPEHLPRMADFARWVVAAEPALGWTPGTFLNVYTRNLNNANEAALEASPVGMAVRALLDYHRRWQGTATQLLDELERRAGDASRGRNWPQGPRGLTNAMKRLAPALRRVGIGITQKHLKERTIIMEFTGKTAPVPSASTASQDRHDDDVLI